MGSSSLTRNWNQAPRIGRAGSETPDHQGSLEQPVLVFFLTSCILSGHLFCHPEVCECICLTEPSLHLCWCGQKALSPTWEDIISDWETCLGARSYIKLLLGWVNSRMTSVLKELMVLAEQRKSHHEIKWRLMNNLLFFAASPSPRSFPINYIPFVLVYIVEPEWFDL